MKILQEVKESVTGEEEGEFILNYKTDSGMEVDVLKYTSHAEREKLKAELKQAKERKLFDEELDELVNYLRIQADLDADSIAARNPYVKKHIANLRKWADRITQIDAILKGRTE